MNKEEILQKARQENKGKDEVFQTTNRLAGKVSQLVGLCACLLFQFLEMIFLQTDIIGKICFSIWCIMWAAQSWVYVFRWNQKKRLYLISAIGCSIVGMISALVVFLGF